MTKMTFDDETLMAFADGELDAERSRELETALESDDALVDRLAVFIDSRRLVADALGPLIDEPVPAALLASVESLVEDANRDIASMGTVTPFRPKPERPQLARWLAPMAAGLVAVASGLAGYGLGRSDSPSGPETIGLIETALASAASGQDMRLDETGTVLRIIATFEDGQGELCREYELRESGKHTIAVACRLDDGWTPRLALSNAAPEGYIPAASQETIDAFLASIQASQPLSADAEQSVLRP